MSENAEAKIESPPSVSTALQKDPKLLARLVLREGKSFKASALAAGYTQSTADKGHKWLCSVSGEASAAFQAETASLTAQRLVDLKPMAVKRLQDEIANPKSVAGMKAIELAGRFKENDWFVRNADVQVGVMAVLGDAQAAESAKNSITSYIDVETDEKQE
jgi:hypothetical protein